MSKNKKHRTNDLSKYLKYFGNQLTGEEKHAFEKSLMQDSFEEEAFDGLAELSYEELHTDLADLQSRIKGKKQKRGAIYLPLFRYAAGIILILGVGTLVYTLYKSVKPIRSNKKRFLQLLSTQQKKKLSPNKSAQLKKKSRKVTILMRLLKFTTYKKPRLCDLKAWKPK
jgi:hypothetical protein